MAKNSMENTPHLISVMYFRQLPSPSSSFLSHLQTQSLKTTIHNHHCKPQHTTTTIHHYRETSKLFFQKILNKIRMFWTIKSGRITHTRYPNRFSMTGLFELFKLMYLGSSFYVIQVANQNFKPHPRLKYKNPSNLEFDWIAENNHTLPWPRLHYFSCFWPRLPRLRRCRVRGLGGGLVVWVAMVVWGGYSLVWLVGVVGVGGRRVQKEMKIKYSMNILFFGKGCYLQGPD